MAPEASSAEGLDCLSFDSLVQEVTSVAKALQAWKDLYAFSEGTAKTATQKEKASAT